MKHLLLLSLFLLGSFFSFGQNSLKELSSMPKDEKGRLPFWRCATVEVDEALHADNPKLPSTEEFESFIEKAKIRRKQTMMQTLEEQIYIIPVVVHIIHNGEAVGTGSNIPYDQVLSQIEVLNEDFRKKEGSRGHNDHPAGADSQIEFVLAEVGPDGEMLAEPGVHRVRNTDLGVSGSLGPYQMDNTVKPATIWDPLRYLNMWTADLGGGLLGYAQFPVASGLDGLDLDGLATAAETDGVVMRYTTFGSSDKGDFNLYAPYDKGRVTTHEVGHFLGLRHIWGDGGCGVDDFCSDTPVSDGPNFDCNTTYFSCGSEDMTQNYMDYSTDPCMSIFTLDQKERFMAVLENSPRRKELLTSNVLARANFTADKTTLYQGQKVVFADESVGDFNSRSWVFEGGEPGTSVLQNPEVVYPATGVYSVTLTVQDANTAYEELKESYITVLEPSVVPAVDFTAESHSAYTGHPLQFQDASDETVHTWEWTFEGGEPATSNLQHPLVTYSQTGTYAVSLTVSNAKGSATHTKESFMEVVTGPVAVVTPALFKEALLTGESVVKNLTIENAGDAALTYALSTDFEAGIVSFAAAEESGSIPAGASKSVAITFGAGSLNGGIYTGTVSVVTNDPRRELVEVPTELNITGIPAAEISHTELDFGNIRKGESKQQILTITNTGTDVLTLTPVLGSDYFSVDNALISIEPKSAFELSVIYNPLVVGTHTASLLLETNDPANPQLSVSLSGTGSPAPEIVLTPAELNVELNAGETKDETLSIKNAGGTDLTYSIKIRKSQPGEVNAKSTTALHSSAEPDNTPSASSLLHSGVVSPINSAGEEPAVLVIQDTDAWYVDIATEVVAPLGISATRINSSEIGATDFADYDLIITAGDEYGTYYQLISDFVAKFEAFASGGGTIIYQTATHGANVSLAGGAVSEGGYLESYNEIISLDHPMVQGLPARLSGYYASHNIITSLPENADIIIRAADSGHPVTVEYSLGAGTIIATGMTWEYAFEYGYDYGVLATTSVEYALENSAAAWLSTQTQSGILGAGEEQDMILKVDATQLLGGKYFADVHFYTNDPVNETKIFPVSLLVTGVPEVVLSDPGLDFGRVWLGQEGKQVLTIQNPGTDSLRITSAFSHTSFTTPTAAVTIPPKKEYLLEITYKPETSGDVAATLSLETNDPLNTLVEVTLSAAATEPPKVLADPAEFLVELFSGEVKTENLLLENVGGDTLFYSLRAFDLTGKEARKESGIIPKGEIPAKGEKDLRVGDPVILRTGNDGADGFGYSWKDSKSANGPVFNWIDISSTGTTLHLGDDNSTSVTLPFSFPFYGQEKSMVYVSSNGFLTFNYEGSASLGNTTLPDQNFPNDLIAAYWVDLYPGSKVTWFGSQDYFIVQFTDVPTYSGSGVLTFQYILYPDGDIKLQYLSTTNTAHAGTIGIENANGTDGLLMAFNTQFVENELAVMITPEKTISFVPESGRILPGATANVAVSFNAEDLIGGSWKKEIQLTTNDPLNELLIIPVTMEVTGAPKMEVSEETLVFEDGIFTGETARRSVLIQNLGTDELLLNSLTVSTQVFSLSASEGILQPGESLEILVDFNTSQAGEFTDNLLIISNDPLAGSLSIPLQAVAFQPPVMELSAESLQASLYTGEESALKTLTISNTGGYPLSVNFSGKSASFAESTGMSAERKVDFYAGKAKPYAAVVPSDSEGLLGPSGMSFSSSAAGEIVEETFPDFTDGTTGMAWVNGGLYALDYYSGYLMKYDFEQQQGIQQFYVSYNPYGLTWDGDYLWVAQGNTAYAYSLSGENMGSFNLPNSTSNYRGMAWDGEAFLVYEPFTQNQVQRVSETGEVLGTYLLPEGVYIDQMVVSGNTLWATDLNSRALYSMTLGTDKILLDENHGFPFSENTYSLAVDEGGALWVADWYSLYKLNLRSLRFPDWIVTDVPDTVIIIAEGQQQSFNFNFKALEGMPVGNYLQELSINSNDPIQAASNFSLSMEILNSVPEPFFQPAEVEMAFKENHQLDLLEVFKDANTADQLTFFARADNDRAILSLSNNLLNIEAVKGGESQITVFAKDQHGAKSPEVTFLVVVVDPDNNTPKVTGSLATQTIETGKTGRLVLHDLFSDPDGDPLRFEISRDTEEYLKSELTNENNLLFTGLQKGTTNYTIRAKDGRGGQAELSFQVIVNQRPQVRVTLPDKILLVKTDTLYLKLSDYILNAEGSIPEFSVTADKQEMLEITLSENSLRIVALQAGETNLTLTAKDNQEGSAEASFKVLGHHPPQVKESLPAVTLNLAESRSVNLFPYFTEADGEAVTYTVAFEANQLDAQIIGSVLDLTGKVTGESVVKVMVKDSRGAEVHSEFQVNVVEVLALGGEKSMEVKLFPNPFEEALFIEIENEERGTFTIILQDPLGREVKRKDLEKTGFKLEASLSLPGLSPGTYFLTISGNNGNSFHKVIKQ